MLQAINTIYRQKPIVSSDVVCSNKSKRKKKELRKVCVFHLITQSLPCVATSLGKQIDVGEIFVGIQSVEDVEQVIRAVFPFEAKLMMRHDSLCNVNEESETSK